MEFLKAVFMVFLALWEKADVPGGLSSRKTLKLIGKINSNGPYIGLVVPNFFEMNPLLQSPSFKKDGTYPHFDFSGRRFRFGMIGKKKVIVIMTGLSMLNAGITTQLLLSLFKVEGVVHFGVAGNANPSLQIGDVTIPQFWAHTGLWNWQRYGDGPDDYLPLESNGDYTRELGHLHFADFNNYTENEGPPSNLLNSVWYQPEEVFPIDGTPEVRQHAFWIPVNREYFDVSKKLKDVKLKRCLNSTTCLPRQPVATTVSRGTSANMFVDNAAYRAFLYSKFDVTPIDMESAAVGLVCLQQRIPFIALRSLSDLAGGGSSVSNEASIFALLAAQNSVEAAIRFIQLLPA
ncbi:unnamed protein product [Victoria cruziana]